MSSTTGVPAALVQLSLRNVVGSFTAVYTVAMAFYHSLWNPTGIEPAPKTRTSTRREASHKAGKPKRAAAELETGAVPAP